MRNKKVLPMVQAAIIAALYVVATMLTNALGLASNAIQIRFSEAMTILPVFTPAAIPGLAIGCFLSNLLTGCVPMDILFGTLATLLGAIGTRMLRFNRWLVPIPPILANVLIIPFVLAYAYGAEGTIPYFMVTIGIGEIISCYLLGMGLFKVLSKYRNVMFES